MALSLARVVLHAPDWVVFDDTFSAMEDETLERIIELFTHELTRTTIIHIGRSTQAHLPLFSRVLHLTRVDQRSRRKGRVGNRPNPAPKAMKRFAATILLLLFAIAIAARPTPAEAQDFGFEPPADVSDSALPDALRDLAERVLPVYQEDDPDRYLSNLAALQMAIGDPAAAHATRLTLQERLQSEQSSLPAGRAVVYDIYVQARAIERRRASRSRAPTAKHSGRR